MRKVRSLVILTLVMSLLLSMLCVAPATAASTLEFQGTTTTVFDQSFGGLSAAPSAFSMSGTWTYTPKYSVALGTNEASIMSKNAYDASAGEGYIFKIGASYSINGFIMYLGWDSSTNTGYQLAMYQGIMYLYKDAAFSTNTTTGLGNHANCVAVSKTYPGSNAYYGLRRYYTVTVTDAGVTVSSDRDANMITYTLPEGETVSKNGKFGVKSQWTTNFAVWYMTLETIDSNIKVNRWMVDETFNTSDTLDSLKSQGFSFSSSATLVSDGLKTGDNTSMTYDYAALSGDYVVETSVFKSYNSNYLIFNYVDDNNHYVYRYGQKGDHSLTKVVNGTSYVLDEVAAGSSYQGTGCFTTYVLRNEVDETTGDLKITVTRKNSATKVVEVTDYYDDENETTPNGAPITEGKFKLKFDSTNDTRIGYFKAYSLVDAADQSDADTNGEIPVFKGRFYNGSNAIKAMAKGEIYFGYPTKLLGDYTVLACLYDNNEMIDIAVLDELDIYKDKTMLFDTTSVSDDAYIKVYFIDSLGRMNYLSDVYTLN